MDLSSKDFTLNFRGFEHDDPETVKKFTAFCEANFALSPEQVNLLGSNPNTIVLTHGGSLDELEALAKVLREIGALVEVSKDHEGELPSLLGAPSTQELHRLFGSRQGSSNDDAAPSCPYPPPLGRSLYLFSNSDAVVDRRALRRKMNSVAISTDTKKTTLRSSHRALLIFSALTLGLGVAALVVAAVLLKRGAVNHNRANATFSQSRFAEDARIGTTAQEDAPPRTLISTINTQDLGVELKVVASTKAVSVNSLTLTPQGDPRPQDGITIKRIVGDPTFLSEISPGQWQGTVLLSIFMEDGGIPSHFTTPAEIEVRVNGDRSVARASIRTGSSASPNNGAVTISRGNDNTFEVSRILVEELSLS
jgi:hypothetical protein